MPAHLGADVAQTLTTSFAEDLGGNEHQKSIENTLEKLYYFVELNIMILELNQVGNVLD